MVIYIEFKSTGLEQGIITNTGAMSKGHRHDIINDIGTIYTGLGYIIISDIDHVQRNQYFNNDKVMVSVHS